MQGIVGGRYIASPESIAQGNSFHRRLDLVFVGSDKGKLWLRVISTRTDSRSLDGLLGVSGHLSEIWNDRSDRGLVFTKT